MAVGDSITEGGTNFSSYLCPLYKKLIAAGYDVEFVGSRTNQCIATSVRHEGHSGKPAEYLADILGARFGANPADIVLIHSGHNHTNTEKPVPGIIAATAKMISTVRSKNPQVIVLLAKVIPSGKLPKYEYLPQLNTELGRLGKRLGTAQQPVIVVDMSPNFDWRTDTVEDHVHPNPLGAEKIARCWFGALAQVMGRPDRPTHSEIVPGRW